MLHAGHPPQMDGIAPQIVHRILVVIAVVLGVAALTAAGGVYAVVFIILGPMLA